MASFIGESENKEIVNQLQQYLEKSHAGLDICKETIKDLKTLTFDSDKYKDKEILNKTAKTLGTDTQKMLEALKRDSRGLIEQFELLEKCLEAEIKELSPFFKQLKNHLVAAAKSLGIALRSHNENKYQIYKSLNRKYGVVLNEIQETIGQMLYDVESTADSYKGAFNSFYKTIIEAESTNHGNTLDRIKGLIDGFLKDHIGHSEYANIIKGGDDNISKTFANNFFANSKTIMRELEEDQLFKKYFDKGWSSIKEDKKEKDFKEKLKTLVNILFAGDDKVKYHLDNIFGKKTSNDDDGNEEIKEIEKKIIGNIGHLRSFIIWIHNITEENKPNENELKHHLDNLINALNSFVNLKEDKDERNEYLKEILKKGFNKKDIGEETIKAFFILIEGLITTINNNNNLDAVGQSLIPILNKLEEIGIIKNLKNFLNTGKNE